ncbi:hypothetical protein CB1_000287038 [Camelus ferus]|nr:hypothetical protein CB1_000287038 [Camelus ferus]
MHRLVVVLAPGPGHFLTSAIQEPGRGNRTLTSDVLLCCRALPVMYAVALDLRVFANNGSTLMRIRVAQGFSGVRGEDSGLYGVASLRGSAEASFGAAVLSAWVLTPFTVLKTIDDL